MKAKITKQKRVARWVYSVLVVGSISIVLLMVALVQHTNNTRIQNTQFAKAFTAIDHPYMKMFFSKLSFPILSSQIYVKNDNEVTANSITGTIYDDLTQNDRGGGTDVGAMGYVTMQLPAALRELGAPADPNPETARIPGKPIPNVRVELVDYNRKVVAVTTTDINGKYTFNLPQLNLPLVPQPVVCLIALFWL